MDDIPGHSICAVACTLSRDHASNAWIVRRASCSNKWFGEVGHAIGRSLNSELARPKPAMGTAVIGGMLAASLVGIFFIPAMFYLVEKWSGAGRRSPLLSAPTAPAEAD
jgi:hypothetical protein